MLLVDSNSGLDCAPPFILTLEAYQDCVSIGLENLTRSID
jgi:hypothetical protein